MDFKENNFENENNNLEFEENSFEIEEESLEEQETSRPSQTLNTINLPPINETKDYNIANKGLKTFAIIMAIVIFTTFVSLAGYFVGKDSVKISSKKDKVELNLAATPSKTDEMTAGQVYEKVSSSIVGITIYNSKGETAGASGIVFSKDGYIVTNDHIYSEIDNPKFKIYTQDGKEYDATYVAGDSVSDLGVLKIEANKLKPAVFGNSDQIFHGQNVVAIGRPGDATTYSSITNGIISATSRRVSTTSNYSARLIETSCPINPGSSGGALVNMYGQVIGVTSSKLVSAEHDNVGYAIPTTVMKKIVDELITNGKVISRAKLGITYYAVDSVTAEVKGYDTVGLYIESIAEDSDLFGKAQKGDIITHVNGEKIVNDDVVLDFLEKCSAGDTITVTVLDTKGVTSDINVLLKANIGTSSYNTQSSSNEENENYNGKFDFPQGE